ncbi:DMT family transporter [Pelosinus propionicus]|uniref:Permease of the drug/metabolite transporter (DMT) superfamily n=1 Tax=Pelosinus propionicus DSM 13327 TaxID=1123291 RepID=A0A1I4Q2I2_9FIRM|nr:DMT family transporter [Pelosinus propionicus]SFM34272.1 Permease of the drug/metabolite transporter (DMT) superfamily [Pelosinus propionicus DSM 13327]
MTGQNKKITGILLTLLGGGFWGLSGACGQYLFEYKGATSEWLVPIRLLLAGYAMLAFFLIKDRKSTLSVWKTKKNAIDIIFYGLAGMMLCQYTYFATIENSNAGTATVIQYLSPVMIMAVVCFMEKKLPNIAELVAMACALLGVFLIATHGNINQMIISKEALFYGLNTAIAVVIYNLQPRNLMKQFSTPLLIAWAMVIGGTVLCIIFKPWIYSPIIDLEAVMALTAIILFGTIVSFCFYMQGVKLIGATHASMYASVEPVSAALLSFLWLKVSFEIVDFVGFALIILTIFILALASKGDILNAKIKQNV